MKKKLPSAWRHDSMALTGRTWRCPNCGGDCFGSDRTHYYCHGHSYGKSTEQTRGCGYWESIYLPENGVGMVTMNGAHK
jgi:hypothetical protein